MQHLFVISANLIPDQAKVFGLQLSRE